MAKIEYYYVGVKKLKAQALFSACQKRVAEIHIEFWYKIGSYMDEGNLIAEW